MKSVLISIQPKWCELIVDGKKTIEVRKTKPKLDTPFKVYIYCTEKDYDKIFCIDKFMHKVFLVGNGKQKVIGEFVCNKVEQGHIVWVKEQSEYYDKVDKRTQLTYRQMLEYLGEKGIGYFWHISNLVIYDKPKELNEFKRAKTFARKMRQEFFKKDPCCVEDYKITRPPQSWCYVEEKE